MRLCMPACMEGAVNCGSSCQRKLCICDMAAPPGTGSSATL
jgi:hypothetical protein